MAGKSAGTAPRSGRLRPAARDSVLEAASQVFVERGFAGASVDLIAQRAGVSKPTIYAQFSGKEELFVEILTSVCDSLAAPMVEEGAGTEDLQTILQRIATSYTKAVLKPDVIALHRLFLAEAERFPTLARRYFEAGPDRAHQALARFLAARMLQGEIRSQDSMMLAELFAAMVLGPIRSRLLFAVVEEVDWELVERANRTAVSLFLDGCSHR